MDLVKQQKIKTSFKWIGFIINLPAWYFILKTIVNGINSGILNSSSTSAFIELEKTGILLEFKTYRNIFYTIYIVIFICIGLYILIQQMNHNPVNKESTVSKILPQLIVGLLLITFSYTIAALILDLYLLSLKLFGGT